MRRPLLRTAGFVRAAKRAVCRNPALAEDLRAALALPEEDALHPGLRTHRLKGSPAGSWACSAGYDLRILFSFVDHQGAEAVLIETVGTHDEVYCHSFPPTAPVRKATRPSPDGRFHSFVRRTTQQMSLRNTGPRGVTEIMKIFLRAPKIA